MRNAERPRVVSRLRLFRRLAAVCAVVLAFAAVPRSEAARFVQLMPGANALTNGGPVQISAQRVFDGPVESGYFPLSVSIRNDSPEELEWSAEFASQNIRFSGVNNRRWEMANFSTTAQAMRVPAGASREFMLCFPCPGSAGMHVKFQGPYIDDITLQVVAYGSVPKVVLSSPEAKVHVADLQTSRRGSVEKREPLVWAREQFLSDWRPYTALSAIALTLGDWSALKPAQREAIRSYVARGGHIDFVDGKFGAGLALPEEFGGGAVRVDAGARPYGLGNVSVQYFTSSREHGLAWSGLVPAGTDAFAPAQGADPLDRGLPRWTLFGVLGVSAILSGPVSLLWLARRRGRHWLFIALPAIALGGATLLGLVVTLRDGFGGRGGRELYASLVDGRPELAIHQLQMARCGLLLNRKFSVPDDAMVHVGAHWLTPVTIAVRRDGSTLSGDWFRNRTTTFQAITTLVPSRAELRWIPGNAKEAPRVLSSFGGSLRGVLVTVDGSVWGADVVSPGVETPLRRMNPQDWSQQITQQRSANNTALADAANRVGRENGFFARADKLEGLPVPTLDGIEWTDTLYVSGHCIDGKGGVR